MKPILSTLFVVLLTFSQIYTLNVNESLDSMSDEEWNNLLNEQFKNILQSSETTSAVQIYGASTSADDTCADELKLIIEDVKQAITLYKEGKSTLLALKVTKIISEWKSKVEPNCQNLINCVMKDQKEIKNIIDMIDDIMNGRIIATIEEIFKVISRIGGLIKHCPFFCYGPTFKKCQREHPGNPCEMNGLIVYPVCREGFTNWGCCVCATVCPPGFHDDGLYCLKPSSYGRGVGYPLWDEDRCKRDNPNLGCEKWGLIWYPKCRAGFHNVACCVCSPNCPSGWTDIGISCKKPESYGRGVGYPVTAGLACLLG